METPENVPVLEKRLFKNEVTGGWRLDFKVRLPESKGMVQSLIATGDKSAAPLWFSALLKRGENLPEPLSETWNYPLHPLE